MLGRLGACRSGIATLSADLAPNHIKAVVQDEQAASSSASESVSVPPWLASSTVGGSLQAMLLFHFPSANALPSALAMTAGRRVPRLVLGREREQGERDGHWGNEGSWVNLRHNHNLPNLPQAYRTRKASWSWSRTSPKVESGC